MTIEFKPAMLCAGQIFLMNYPAASYGVSKTARNEASFGEYDPERLFKPVQYLFMLMNIATYKHEKSKITHFY